MLCSTLTVCMCTHRCILGVPFVSVRLRVQKYVFIQGQFITRTHAHAQTRTHAQLHMAPHNHAGVYMCAYLLFVSESTSAYICVLIVHTHIQLVRMHMYV